MKKILAFVACVLVLISVLVVPLFAMPTEETQGNFLYNNKNTDYVVAELRASTRFSDFPRPDMILDLGTGDFLKPPVSPSFPSVDSGYFTNPFLVSNFSTLVYTDPVTRQTVALPFGRVELSYSLAVTDELGNTTAPSYNLKYSVWEGDVAVETYRFIYRVEYNRKDRNIWEVGDLTDSGYIYDGFRLYIFMGGSDYESIPLTVYKDNIITLSGIGVSYPYLIGSQYQQGYNNGLADGQQIMSEETYNQGYQAGLNATTEEAYQEGYNEAVKQIDSGTFGAQFLGNALSAPFKALSSFVIADAGGVEITIGGLFGCAIVILLLVVFLRMFAGG